MGSGATARKRAPGFTSTKRVSASRFLIPRSRKFSPRKRKAAGIAPRPASDEEIVKRLVYALVNVGAELLRTGIALRAGDEDIVYIYGYGFPPHTGGPMWYADQVGIANVYADIKKFGWEASPLLAELAQSGGKLAGHRSSSKELAHA